MIEASAEGGEGIRPVEGGSSSRRLDRGGMRRSLLAQVLRQPHTRVGLPLLIGVVLLALLGPLFAPYGEDEIVGAPFMPPSGEFLLGTDYLGMDVLSRTLFGGASVLWMSLAAATLGTGLGLIIGLIAGYRQGWVDALLMRTMDVVLAFPQVVLVLLFVALLGSPPWLIVTLVAVAWTPQVARVVRALTVAITGREFIDAAEAVGQPRRRILGREVLPSIMTPLSVEYGLRIAWSIAAIAAIGFLGFGIQPPDADWGVMINENRNGLVSQPWSVRAPVFCVAVFALGANLIAEGTSRAVAGIDRYTGGG